MQKVIEWLTQNAYWIVPLLLGFERVQAFVAEYHGLIATLCRAVDAPMSGKELVRESPQGDSVLLNSTLDKESPLVGLAGFGQEPKKRVSKARKIGSAVFKLIPLASRAGPLLRLLFGKK